MWGYRVNREPEFEGGRETGDGPIDEFEAIVAGWRREGGVPEWPVDHPTEPLTPTEPPTRPHRIVPPRALPSSATVPTPTVDETQPLERTPAVDADEHFVPPEPPPLPRIGPPALIGGVLLLVGLVLAVAPGWLGASEQYGLPLGLICLAAGLGWMVLRLWPDSATGEDRDADDDGAVV